MFQAGTKHRGAKLTADDIKTIRALYIPYIYGCRKLAKRYGVSDETIRRVIINKSYQGV